MPAEAYKSFTGDGADYSLSYALSDTQTTDTDEGTFNKLVLKKLVCLANNDTTSGNDELQLDVAVDFDDALGTSSGNYTLTNSDVGDGDTWTFDPPLSTEFKLNVTITLTEKDSTSKDDVLGVITIGSGDQATTDGMKVFSAEDAIYNLYYELYPAESGGLPFEPGGEEVVEEFRLQEIEVVKADGSRNRGVEWELEFTVKYGSELDGWDQDGHYTWSEAQVQDGGVYQEGDDFEPFEHQLTVQSGAKKVRIEVSGTVTYEGQTSSLPTASIDYSADENWGIGYGTQELESRTDPQYAYVIRYTIAELEGVASLTHSIPTDAAYVVNHNHKEIHLATCHFVPQIKAPEDIDYAQVESLIRGGYDGCHFCISKLNWQ